MHQPSPRDGRPSLSHLFGDINAVLFALAIGLAVLDGTCFAAFKLIHAMAPLIRVVPDINQPWTPRAAAATPQSAKP